jgi:hypothetical protein
MIISIILQLIYYGRMVLGTLQLFVDATKMARRVRYRFA